MLGFLNANADAIQAFVAILAAGSLIPAAVVFFLNQADERKEIKERRYLGLNDEYKEFLRLTLEYPTLAAMQYSQPRDDKDLTSYELAQRDTIFELFTSMIERAFLSFLDGRESFRLEQWPGWLEYTKEYCARSDYRGWWQRIVGTGNWAQALSTGASQYDQRFEAFMVELLDEAIHQGR